MHGNDQAPLDPVPLPFPIEKALEFSKKANSENTRRAYAADWKDFRTFCERHHNPSLPASAETVYAYLFTLKDTVSSSTLQRRCAGIAYYHADARLPNPTKHAEVRKLLRAVANDKKRAPKPKRAITEDLLAAMLLQVPRNDLKARRDRAVILLAFAGAFRRSELAALDVEDVEERREGFIVTVRSAKTDHEATFLQKEIPALRQPFCPFRAVNELRHAAHITAGPLFRSFSLDGELQERRLTDHDVAWIIKRLCKKAGLDATQFAGHSMRRGFITEATRKRVSIADIKKVTHQSDRTVLRYIEAAETFVDPPLLRIFESRE